MNVKSTYFKLVCVAMATSVALFVGAMVARAAPPAQMRLGYTTGDQWEPAIAADRLGHVYVLYPQYKGVPDCASCPSPTMILQISGDHGATWGAPRPIAPPGTGQWDAQIVVDAVDGRTVYAAWLQNNKDNTVVARSTDFGATWAVVVADRTNGGTDKPILAARGRDVYVAFNHSRTAYVAVSHNGGKSFKAVELAVGALGWSLPSGGAVDPAGHVYFAWAGYKNSGNANGPVNLFITRSVDGGLTWTIKRIDVSGAPPDCSAYKCGWGFLGAQMALAADAEGTLYALWNASLADKRPARLYFAKSRDAGAHWTAKVDVSRAPPRTQHAFPALAAGARNDVRLAWMDTRAGGLWNTYYRRSTNGGATWSAETDVSTYVDGYSYIFPNGFGFPFGDYFEMDLGQDGTTHLVWGEGLNYDAPGSIWYAQVK